MMQNRIPSNVEPGRLSVGGVGAVSLVTTTSSSCRCQCPVLPTECCSRSIAVLGRLPTHTALRLFVLVLEDPPGWRHSLRHIPCGSCSRAGRAVGSRSWSTSMRTLSPQTRWDQLHMTLLERPSPASCIFGCPVPYGSVIDRSKSRFFRPSSSKAKEPFTAESDTDSQAMAGTLQQPAFAALWGLWGLGWSLTWVMTHDIDIGVLLRPCDGGADAPSLPSHS